MTLLCNWITLPLDENFSKSHYTHYTSAQSTIPDRVPSHRNLSFHLFSSLRLRRWDLEPQPDDCSQNSMAKSNLCRRHNTQFTNNYAIKINFYCHPVRQLVFSFHATDVQRGKRRMDYAMDWRTRRGECALCCAHRVVKYADEIRIIFFLCWKFAKSVLLFVESSLPSTTKLLQIEMFILSYFRVVSHVFLGLVAPNVYRCIIRVSFGTMAPLALKSSQKRGMAVCSFSPFQLLHILFFKDVFDLATSTLWTTTKCTTTSTAYDLLNSTKTT